MTYDLVTPYLKGLHLTLAAHHPQHDNQGWKLSPKEWDVYVWGKASDEKLAMDEDKSFSEVANDSPPPEAKSKQQANHFSMGDTLEPPKEVKPVARLRFDLDALDQLFDSETPTKNLLRAARIYSILYGFANASGTAFGSTVLGKDGNHYRIGTWESDVDHNSSNFCEFENFVCALEYEATKGNLDDAIIFLCTDNLTVKAGLEKGNSTSKKLFELVLRTRLLQNKFRCQTVVTHVSRKQMMAQGTDGVSRGHLKEGVSTGEDMLKFIPLNLSTLDWSDALRVWIQSWLGNKAEFLEPDDWFERGHNVAGGSKDSTDFWRPKISPGIFVWSPSPDAAGIALEELRKVRIKRQESLHVIVIPRLLKPELFRQFHETCDLIFDIPPGADCWDTNQFEPIVVGIVFPFLSRSPSQLRRTPKIFHVAKMVSKMWEVGNLAAGDFCADFYWSMLNYPLCRQMRIFIGVC
jgi:hypothetical protein